MTRRLLRILAHWLPFVLFAVFVHVSLLCAGLRWAPTWDEVRPKPLPEYVAVRVPPLTATRELTPEEQARLQEMMEEQRLDSKGQIVALAKPLVEQRPEQAEYLSAYDTTVPEETRAPDFMINPEVVAPEMSKETQEQQEESEVAEGDDDDESEKSTPRHEKFDPLRDGVTHKLPGLADPYDTPWLHTDGAGTGDPRRREASDPSRLAGAPQNDLLHEREGTGTYLNAYEVLYYEYIERIRRLVNFYWSQNLDNLPSSVRIAKPEYKTEVDVVLDGEGRVERVDVATTSGIAELDDCVVRAFHLAGPFPNPPETLVARDGRVYLPDMGFTVTFGAASARPVFVDPNPPGQFPGLFTNPR